MVQKYTYQQLAAIFFGRNITIRNYLPWVRSSTVVKK